MDIQLSPEAILVALPKIKVGLTKYIKIMTLVEGDEGFYNSPNFRRSFNGFYRVRRSSVNWQPAFYEIMGRAKLQGFDFPKILTELYNSTGRVEASFASKLYATIVPTAPVIDSVVLVNLGLKLPQPSDSSRLSKIVEIHREIDNKFIQFLNTENGKYLVTAFRNEYPEANISKEKMLDLILWQIR